MKLIIAVVQDEDSQSYFKAYEGWVWGHQVGYYWRILRSGNTTLLIGVDNEKLENAMNLIEQVCKCRKQVATSPSPMGGATGMYVPYPVEVTVGGATVFVVDVEEFRKI